MRKLSLCLLLLTACGSPEVILVEKPVVVEKTREVVTEREVEAPAPQSLEGYYVLENGGYLDLVEDSHGMVTVRAARLPVKNKDGSLGVLPLSSTNALAVEGLTLRHKANLSYNSSCNVRSDISGGMLNGSMFTSVVISKNGESIRVEIKIVSNAGIELERVL